MKRLRLTLACWPYDRTRALADGSVRMEGIDLVYLPLEVEETFWRQARFQEFDASEMSLSSYVKTLNSDKPPFIAIPVFPSRSFRHSCIFVSAKSGIRKPEDLKGKRVAAPEYQMTAPVWIRGILADDFGVKVTDVQHFSGGEEEPGRVEKLKLDLPSHIRYAPIPEGKTISRMLADGELDAFVTARAPSTFYSEPDKVRRLFPDYVEREKDFYRRTKIFPIMHTVVIKREIYDANPWIAQALYKGFETAKKRTLHQLAETHVLANMLPWLVSHVEEAQKLIGEDWWPYGLEANRHVLETFLRHHHEQGLSKRRFKPEEIFARETLVSFKV